MLLVDRGVWEYSTVVPYTPYPYGRPVPKIEVLEAIMLEALAITIAIALGIGLGFALDYLKGI